MSHTLTKIMLLVLAGAVLVSSCSSDDGDTSTNPPAVIPAITVLSDSTLAPGDTLGIGGTDFATPASSNRVVFNNSVGVATPFVASTDSLAVVVPANANSGGLYVTSKGVASNKIDVEVERGVGDVWVMGGSGNYTFNVPASTGSEKYLIVPHSATSSGVSYAYSVTPDNLSPAPSTEGIDAAGTVLTGIRDFAFEFKTRSREEAIDYIKTHEPHSPGPGRRVPDMFSAAAPASRQFKVLARTTNTLDPGSYVTVTADLVYDGTHALIYADVNQPTGSFTQPDYDAFGANFDTSIYPTNTDHFGAPTDIDGNGRIIILFTPQVNELTPDGTAQQEGFISGFVLFNDIAPNVVPSGTTNSGEIFYSMVPDPNGETGNSFPKAIVDEVVPGTLAHEFEHLISNGYRFVILGGGSDWRFLQQTWLEEGMAHMAEDLNNMDEQNILRANLYLGTPFATSLLGNAELRPRVDTLEQRGGIFLFLRYLADRYGEDILKTIVRDPAIGEASIANVTGVDFHASVADYLATLYLSDRGITSDPRYNYSSFNFLDTFGDLSVDNRSVGAGGFSGSVRSATGRFHLLSGTTASTIQFGVSSSSSAGVRCVVIRTE